MNPLRALIAMLALLGLMAWVGCESRPAIRVENRTIDVDGTSREVRVVQPEELPQPCPLVIAFHGFGDTPQSMADYSELDHLAAKHAFLLVYPAGIRQSWQAPMPGASTTQVDADLALFDQLVRQLSAEYSIDANRIYVVGMSQGAIFVQWLATQRASQIAAVAAHSGCPPKNFDYELAKTPVLLIAGQEDLAHDAMREASQLYQNANCNAEFTSIPNLGHAWSAQQNEAIWAFLTRHHAANASSQDAAN